MELTFWGVRGSIPAPGPGTTRYGGNTACVSLRTAADRLIVLDCGTGARNLGISLMNGPLGSGEEMIGSRIADREAALAGNRERAREALLGDVWRRRQEHVGRARLVSKRRLDGLPVLVDAMERPACDVTLNPLQRHAVPEIHDAGSVGEPAIYIGCVR